MPGVSMKTNCAFSRVATPRMRWRVVWGFAAVMLTLKPTSALTSVDLPTLGRPTTATLPLRMLDFLGVDSGHRDFRGGGFGRAPAGAFAVGEEVEVGDET